MDAHSDVEGLPFALGGVDRLDLAGGLVWAARSYFDTLALATRRAEAGATLRSLPAAARET